MHIYLANYFSELITELYTLDHDTCSLAAKPSICYQCFLYFGSLVVHYYIPIHTCEQ